MNSNLEVKVLAICSGALWGHVEDREYLDRCLFNNKFANYNEELIAALRYVSCKDLYEIKTLIENTCVEGSKIFIAGNGGSAATSMHFVNDLNKLASAGRVNKFQAICLHPIML
jgi:D-sedoheptulose 7-phosphate isomerase